MTDPTSRQRGRPTDTRQQLSDNNLRTESNIWWLVPEWARYLDILTDWLTVSGKVTSTSTPRLITYVQVTITNVHAIFFVYYPLLEIFIFYCDMFRFRQNAYDCTKMSIPTTRTKKNTRTWRQPDSSYQHLMTFMISHAALQFWTEINMTL
jgi:hypothetical protein